MATAPRASAPFKAPKSAPGPLSLSLTATRDIVFDCDGTQLLRQLPQEVTVRLAADCSSLILGATSLAGATAALDVCLGQLPTHRVLALSRTCAWWMTPFWGSSAADIPLETQFLLCELRQSGTPLYALFLPLIDSNTFRSTLRPALDPSSTSLGLHINSGSPEVTASSFSNTVIVTAGSDPFELISRGVAAGAALSGAAKPRASKPQPASLDGFGWCTWDAFYSAVSAAGIKQGLASLVDGGAPPKLLIIDDGWQQTDVPPAYRRFEASPVPTAGATAAGIPSAAVLSSWHEVEEAVATLLTVPGDQVPDAIKGIHQFEEAAANGEKGAAEDAAPSAAAALPASLVSKAAAAVKHAVYSLEAGLLHLAKRLLDASPSDSWLIRAFGTLATGPLRGALLRYYSRYDHMRRLVSVRANAKFATADASAAGISLSAPGGDLAAVVASVKAQYGVEYVYAWHALAGFWAGISGAEEDVSSPTPPSEMAKYQPRLMHPRPVRDLLAVDPSLRWNGLTLAGVSLPTDPTALHADLHSYLSSCGIDGVKVDVQGAVGLVGSAAGGGPALASKYHASLDASISRHFPGSHLINCMAHSSENLFNLGANVSRASDDFYPLLPASWTTHIPTCAYNGLFIGELAVPDWDMFHSKHPAAALHATARAVSGSPVYVSDRPGHHNFRLLRSLVFPDGSVLRCRLPGRPTADCLFSDVVRDGKSALKVWNANAITGVVGVFNVQGSEYSTAHRTFRTFNRSPPTLTAVVSPADAPTLDFSAAAGRCLMHSSLTGSMTLVETASDAEADVECGLAVTVPPGGHAIVTLSVVLFSSTADIVSFAPVGLTNMLNAGGAVLGCAFEGSVVMLAVRGRGSFLAHASRRPTAVAMGGAALDFEYDAEAAALRFSIEAEDCKAKRKCLVQF